MRLRWTFSLYHDEDGEAAVDTRQGPDLDTEEQAIDAARGSLSDYWQSATVEVGDFVVGVPGVHPDYWDGERETIAYIGPDGSVDRV